MGWTVFIVKYFDLFSYLSQFVISISILILCQTQKSSVIEKKETLIYQGFEFDCSSLCQTHDFI